MFRSGIFSSSGLTAHPCKSFLTISKTSQDVQNFYVGGPLPLVILICRVLTNPFMDLLFNRKSTLSKWRWILKCNYLGPVIVWAFLELWYIISLAISTRQVKSTNRITFIDSFTSVFYLIVLCTIHTISFILVIKMIKIMSRFSHLFNHDQRYRQALVKHGIPHLATAAQDLVLLSLALNLATLFNGVRPILITIIISIESVAFAFERAMSYLGKSCSVLSIIGRFSQVKSGNIYCDSRNCSKIFNFNISTKFFSKSLSSIDISILDL